MSDDVEPAAASLYRAITDRRESLSTEGGPIASVIEDLRGRLGTKAPAGVSPRTWRRLRADPDRRVTPRIAEALRAAQRRARLSDAREARLRTPRPPLSIDGTIIVSSDERKRTLNVSAWDDVQTDPKLAGLVGRVVDKFLDRDDSGALEEMRDGIDNAMGAGGTLSFGDDVEFDIG